MSWSAVIVPVRLGLKRLGARRLRVALVVIALTGAGAIVGLSSVIGAVALADSVRTQLSSTDPLDRSIMIRDRLDPGDLEVPPNLMAYLSAYADVTTAARVTQVFDPVAPADARGVTIITVDDVSTSVAVLAGRLPTECASDATTCEALSLSGAEVGATVDLPAATSSAVQVVVVGTGDLVQDLPLRRIGGADFVVPNVSGTALAGALAASSATVYLSAPLNPERVAPAELDTLLTNLRASAVTVERESSSATLSAPIELLQRLNRLGDVASTRLLIVASQGAALILAFAAFAATISRRDVELERTELSNLAANRLQLAAVRATESLVPALAALILVVTGLRLALIPLTAGRPGAVELVKAALPWTIVVVIAGLEVVAAVMLFVAVAPPRRNRIGFGALELAAALALALVLWQAFASGGFDPDEIGVGSAANPVLLLVPGLAVLVAGIVLLRVLPMVFRGAERMARRSTVSVRLALLAAARNPAGSSAVTTFLAVAVGSAIFGLNYAATLEQQAHDEAQFSVGAFVRTIDLAGGPAERECCQSMEIPRVRSGCLAPHQRDPVGSAVRATGVAGEPPETGPRLA